MFKRLRRFWKVLKYFLNDDDTLILYLLEQKALDCLEDCYKLKVSTTEELEDLIFHIKSYISIPKTLIETKFPEMHDIDLKKRKSKLTEKQAEFILEVEKQRAVERDFIFEHAKVLTLGFKLKDIFNC